MVSKSSKRCSLIYLLPIVAAVIATITFSIVAVTPSRNNETSEPDVVVPEPEPEPEPAVPQVIDLQPIVDQWAATLSRNSRAGVFIYDLDNHTVSASYHADDVFSTASLYKLFVVYEAYRRMEQGIGDPSDSVASGHSRQVCLDLAIRESNSPCAETLLSEIGYSSMQSIIENNYQLPRSSILSFTSTAADMAHMLEIYYNHSDLSETSWDAIQDSMLNQPPVENGLCNGPCDWRGGLPSGFKTAQVYNKVGWDYSAALRGWNIYNDAAIVEFPEQRRHYIIVVMSHLVSTAQLSNLGALLEQAIMTN